MRIPGTRNLERRFVSALELTATDRRVLTRGWRTALHVATGELATALTLGFSLGKAAITAAVATLTSMAGKKQREERTAALYSEPPSKEDV